LWYQYPKRTSYKKKKKRFSSGTSIQQDPLLKNKKKKNKKNNLTATYFEASISVFDSSLFDTVSPAPSDMITALICHHAFL
jgi:hypothetical protein